jgi:hypothetical protein
MQLRGLGGFKNAAQRNVKPDHAPYIVPRDRTIIETQTTFNTYTEPPQLHKHAVVGRAVSSDRYI